MNDSIQIETIILERERRYIGLTEDISSDLFHMLVQTTPAIVSSLFKKKNPNIKQIHSHDTTIKCSVCSSEFICKALTIAQVQSYIKEQRDHHGSLCVACRKEQDVWNKEEKERQKLKDKQTVENNTEIMIGVYLDTNRSWKPEYPHKERFHKVTGYSVNNSVVKEHIKQMKYSLFLQTPYWKAIAQEVRRRARFECGQCGSSKNLVAHHITYENHGIEHGIGFHDLICLCDKCHKETHNIQDK